VTQKLAVVFPAATVTVDGVVAEGSLLLRFTTTPPVGADELKVTVATEVEPPANVAGLSLRLVRVKALIARRALTEFAPDPAEMFADVAVATLAVVTVNVAFVAPAGTITVDGTVATV
jgi:hypothetical protein